MSEILDGVLAANAAYAESFGSTALPHGPRFAVLTCMDARLDPVQFAGAGRRRRPCHPQRGRAGE